jgi:hypothetical protein
MDGRSKDKEDHPRHALWSRLLTKKIRSPQYGPSIATLTMNLSGRNSSYTVNIRSVYNTDKLRTVFLRHIIRLNTDCFRSVLPQSIRFNSMYGPFSDRERYRFDQSGYYYLLCKV